MATKATTTQAAGGCCAGEGSRPRIARRGVASTTRLGRHRWKVERSLAWLLANRRLTVRYQRRADISQAFLHLGCALICARKLHPL
jgi:transposase